MSFHPKTCPNSKCNNHLKTGGLFYKKGFYKVKCISTSYRRFQCQACNVTFSSRSFKSDRYHKKIYLNQKLSDLLNHGVSIRASAQLLEMTYKNTYNKFLWLCEQAKAKKQKLQLTARSLQFDEMETIHHTKCKPLSIAIMVNENYQILSLEVAQIPAKGLLAQVSIKKYGIRPDEREDVLHKSFTELKKRLVTDIEELKSDAKPSYVKFPERYFNGVPHFCYSRRDKDRHRDRLHEKFTKKVFDPLFALNQRCAKLRSDIKRLTRRSWCTTKKIENLQGHLDLYLVSQFC